MTNDTSCALLLESAKKICKFAKIEFFIAKSSYIVKMFAKQNLSKKWKIFKKPLPMPFQICQNFCKILNNLIFNQEKLIKCKFTLTCCLQKICNFFAKLVQFVLLCQILTSESGSKQRFSLLQEKAVIQTVCLRTQAVSIKARF